MYLLQRARPVHYSTATLSAAPAPTFVTEEKVARRSFHGDPGALIITLTCYLSLTLRLHAEKEPPVPNSNFLSERMRNV